MDSFETVWLAQQPDQENQVLKSDSWGQTNVAASYVIRYEEGGV